ncbi:hypothetical protein [Streptomyces sp. NBRC 110611]|uniref:hypothetical protein n=1 Tax=Streptomyces sp. NBRC 110611 TaxID=1621259 RepID=UPI00082991C7|nr:hypothetical protein [Streptomyces sp. NBRC 110611]
MMLTTPKRAGALLVAGAAATGMLAMAPAANAASAAPAAETVTAAVPQATARLWATDVNARYGPARKYKIRTRHLSGNHRATCQVKGGTVVYGKYKNNWWTYLPNKGWVSDVFLKGGDNWKPVPGIPRCK